MAWAGLSPPAQAQANREKDRLNRLQSADPAVRYNAQQEIYAEAAAAFGKQLIQQAEAARKARIQQELDYERLERQNCKYKRITPQEIHRSNHSK